MIGRWFNNQVLAPDENVAVAADVAEEGTSSFWQLVAPDPNFAAPKAPPPSAFRAPSGQVLCMHCHQWTNVGMTTPNKNDSNTSVPLQTSEATTPTIRTAATKVPYTPFFTPSPSCNYTMGTQSDYAEIESLVLSAAKDTASCMQSPSKERKARDKVFRLCANDKPIDEKLCNRLRKMLKNDQNLIHARATNLGLQVPDGFTLLMACAYSGNVSAAKVVLELASPSALIERDLQGRTALHIAAEMGQLEVIDLLKPLKTPQQDGVEGTISPAPVDLLGRTPLGRAVTSPHLAARTRQKDLETALFSPGDLSVFGVHNPESERMNTYESLQLSYGTSDMPGMRVTMEDAVCIARWEHHGKFYALFGVCDGHGDLGSVSHFIANNIPTVLQSHIAEDKGWDTIWKESCLELDEKLKKSNIEGGSTAVLALITDDLIVVANVGDSRAILIQAKSNSTSLEKQMEKLTVDDDEGYPPAIDKDDPKQATPDPRIRGSEQGSVAIPLSEDHKPNLEQEKARIENAGLKVVPVSFEENGQKGTIYKVFKTDSEQLAVSRAFGDFEYKLNETLLPDEQAVTAVPDVRIHERNHDADLYLILACDGVWDVMNNDAVKDFVLHQVQTRVEVSDTVLPEVGDALLRESLNLGSRDNMTAVIVALSNEVNKLRPTMQGRALEFMSPQK